MFIFFLLILGCVDKTEKIDMSVVQEPGVVLNDSSVKVAIASVVSPKESYEYYDDMIQYISQKLVVM